MITLNTIESSSVQRDKKRVGRGPGSKKGKTCGRGQKGQGAEGVPQQEGQEAAKDAGEGGEGAAEAEQEQGHHGSEAL